ncbi:MAG TPA: (d)CMP kinase [Candidatus Binatia bacterium]|nr:(d)CMP kinase [Candidatus Binatia bacterium]
MGRVIAVDGPAGAGKSSASRTLAQRLGFAYVDTGAMYRAVGVLAAERGVALDDDEALDALVAPLRFSAGGERLVVDGRDLSAAIRTGEAGELASRVSVRPVVRARLVAVQRALAAAGDVVMEGRDIGTVVAPDAAVKFFLTAAPEERARRRAGELAARGERVDVEALARELVVRDARDASRPTAPLRVAADAVVLDTTGRALAAVVAEMERIVRARLEAAPA